MIFILKLGPVMEELTFPLRTETLQDCLSRPGGSLMYGPTVRTILDMGGQDCKVIRCDDKGKVISFLMNDKCAASTGRGMEVFADLLGVPIGGRARSLQVDEEPEPVSSTCVVFAKSEAIGLLHSGWSIESSGCLLFGYSKPYSIIAGEDRNGRRLCYYRWDC